MPLGTSLITHSQPVTTPIQDPVTALYSSPHTAFGPSAAAPAEGLNCAGYPAGGCVKCIPAGAPPTPTAAGGGTSAPPYCGGVDWRGVGCRGCTHVAHLHASHPGLHHVKLALHCIRPMCSSPRRGCELCRVPGRGMCRVHTHRGTPRPTSSRGWHTPRPPVLWGC